MNSTRRGFLKQSSCLIAASALGSTPAAAVLQTSAAPQQAPPPPRPAAGLAGSSSGQLFWVVETTSGKVQGIANTGIKEFKGIPYGAPRSARCR